VRVEGSASSVAEVTRMLNLCGKGLQGIANPVRRLSGGAASSSDHCTVAAA
jgi:hypothetical protein